MKKLIVACISCFIGIIVLLQPSCSRPDKAEIEKYIKEVEEKRSWKDQQFKYGQNSPLTSEQIVTFSGLKYFPVDYEYRVKAKLITFKEPLQFRMQASTGEERIYIKKGELRFKLNRIKYSLMAYQDRNLFLKKEHENSLFVPFTDETTGKQSYGGGRYLEMKAPESGSSMVVDFNLAFNPYCAYNSNYSCPVPPRENHLFVKVLAGEKRFK